VSAAFLCQNLQVAVSGSLTQFQFFAVMSANSASRSSTENPESNSNSNGGDSSSSPTPKPRKVLIGSQRDAADTSLRISKPLQGAAVNPGRVEQALKAAPNPAAPPVAAPEASPVEVPAAPVVPSAMEPPAATAPQTPEVSAVATAIPQETTGVTQPLPATPDPQPVTPQSAVSPATGDVVSASAAIDDELAAALDDLQMESLLGATGTVEDIELDSIVRGIVSRIHNENVFFSLKGHYEGVASLRQFKVPPQEGAMIDVRVAAFREEEGLYEVVIPGAAMSVADWSDLTEGAIVDAKITGSNTGGLECTVQNIRGFIPASQIDIGHVENFGDYVNQKYPCVVTEVNPNRKRLVLSRRAVLEREAHAKKQELMKTLAVGDVMDGIVTRIMDFGAFVDIGGVEGLVHVSKLSWDRVTHPKDVLESGQKISVKVEKIAEDTGKIGLSFRDTQENPWRSVDQKYPVGSVVDGTVSRIAQFGAFVKLEPGIEGLVHISELAHHRVIAVKNVVSQGDRVSVKVLSVDPATQKIGLSLKATQAKPESADNAKEVEEIEEPVRELVVRKSDQPLKGGRSRSSGGEQFGLNW
jgi:small subunit ribosomal protein S1